MRSDLIAYTETVGVFAILSGLGIFAWATSAACTAVSVVSERVDDFTDKAHKLFVGAGQWVN